jgi:hypothetical protein
LTNRLQKTVRTSYVPGSPGIPGDPGQPFIPARWVTESISRCAYQVDAAAMLAAGWTRTYIPPKDAYDSGTYQWTPPSGSDGGQIIYRNICSTTLSSRWAPAQPYRAPVAAVPPTPAQTIIDKLIGWNARAHSKQAFPGYGEFSFTVPRSAVGVIVGLNDVPQDSGYSDIRFAFYLSHGIARVMEQGVEKFYAGAYAEGATFTVRRLKGTIYYEINGVGVYSSPNTDVPLFLDAALYSGGDYVDNPSMRGISGGDVTLPALAALGGDIIISGGYTVLPALTGSGRVGSRADGSLPALIASGGDYALGMSTGVFPALTCQAEGGMLAPSYSVGTGVALFFTGSGYGTTGEIGGSNGVTPAFTGISSEGSYGASAGELPSLVGAASATEGNTNAAVFSMALLQDYMSAPVELVVTMTSTGTVSSVFAVGLVVPAELRSSATASTPWILQALLNAVMKSTATGATVAPLNEEQQAVLVVNLENQGTTRYENYPFNSFAKIGNAYYGAKADGIYRLDGESDAGIPISAMVALGMQDFGISAKKTVPNCYVGLSSGGQLYLKVIVEGLSYTYAARSASSDMQQQRFDLGKGIKANYLEFELYNKDGDDFELDKIEFLVATLSRRI